MKHKNITIIESPGELGAGKRGAGLGPAALRHAELNKNRRKLAAYDIEYVADLNEMLRKPTLFPFAKYIDGISQTLPKLAEKVEEVLVNQKFPLILSGDHSNAAGGIAGVKNFLGEDKRLGVVWIDAHADLHSPYTTPSGNVHGMPLAVSLGMDNLDSQINEPDAVTIRYWDGLKSMGSRAIVPKIYPTDLVFIDIRDLERPEWDLIDEEEIEFYTPKEIKQYGIETVVKETLAYLNACDHIYVSFDVDSMDPTVSKGTGTPYPDGLKLHEAKTLLYHLLKNPKTIALEITEINPLLDSSNQMARAVLEIIEEVL